MSLLNLFEKFSIKKGSKRKSLKMTENNPIYLDSPYIDEEFETIELLCGATASFDHSSGISYRCNTCLAVVGSMGMPRECKKLYDMEKVVRKLKGKK